MTLFPLIPWDCRCRERAPDGIGTIPIRRPADQPRCHVCGTEQTEYLEALAKQQLDWLDYAEKVEQEVFPDARPRSEVIVPCTCFEAGRNDQCPIHGSYAGDGSWK